MKTKIKNARIISLPEIIDGKDGILSVIEEKNDIPFEIQRVFFIYNFSEKTAIRGKHAHKNLEQAIFCLNGHFTIDLDDGKNKQSFFLNSPPKGLYIGKMVWNTMHSFSKDCVILVLASAPFDENDYIRNYQTFKNLV